MSNITEYLILDRKRYGTDIAESVQVEFDTKIVEIPYNPYYLPFGDKGVHHYELQLIPKYREDCEEWSEDVNQTLRFKMSSYSLMPTIEQFSDHIKAECIAILNAIGMDECYVWDVHRLNYDDIEPAMIYKFLKNIHRDYTKTEDFLRDYDHYKNRLYQGMKWIDYIISGGGAMFCMSYDYPIGEHLLAFLEVGKYADFYETVKS
jgi:hypothetical protein